MQKQGRSNLVSRLSQRPYQLWPTVSLQRELQWSMVERLGPEAELAGHTGCVNCLEWSANGELLASGSDDLNVILWDPMRHRKLVQYVSGHTGNIFSVKFLPESGNSLLATCAGDGRVLVHDIERRERLHSFACHAARVKRLAVAPGVPNLFWSAGEDGTIMQFDIRDPDSSSSSQPRNVLVNLNAFCGFNVVECKCVAVNPCRVEQMAVGASDRFVRLYDRRMLPPRTLSFPTSSSSNARNSADRSEYDRQAQQITDEGAFAIDSHAVRYLSPMQFALESGVSNNGESLRRPKFSNVSCTYVTFSPAGDELLANMGGDHVYLYDLAGRADTHWHLPIPVHCAALKRPRTSEEATTDMGQTEGELETIMSDSVKRIKADANVAFEKREYALAVNLYGCAIGEASRNGHHYAVLHSNLAAALLQRKWSGDVYAALHECACALALDVHYLKALCRFAKCLLLLGCFAETLRCTALIRSNIPHSKLDRSRTLLDQLETDARRGLDSRKRETESTIDCEPDPNDLASASTSTSSANLVESEAARARRVLESLEQSVRRHAAVRNGRGIPNTTEHPSQAELSLRRAATDYTMRFCGHCNTTTDIKEANFLGPHHIVAGSDDGTLYFWRRDATTGCGTLVRALLADEAIVNCAQPHPTSCVLASSGIESTVHLWSPRDPDTAIERKVENPLTSAAHNQRRMRVDPFEAMFFSLGLGHRIMPTGDDETDNHPLESDDGDRQLTPSSNSGSGPERRSTHRNSNSGSSSSSASHSHAHAHSHSQRHDRCSPN